MATGVPLLICRAEQGLGPVVPLRQPARVVVVDGLCPTDSVRVYIISKTEKPRILEFKNGETYLDDPIPEGVVLRAELLGQDSSVSISVE